MHRLPIRNSQFAHSLIFKGGSRISIKSTGRGWLLLWLLILALPACRGAQAEQTYGPIPTRTPTRTPTPRPTRPPTVTPTPVVTTPEATGCRLPELAFDQHISASGSYTMTQTEAAGPMVCRIAPNSCAMAYMVGNLDATIVFKREEAPPYDVEDIKMHPSMLMPLYQLNKLVQEEWNGQVQLRITDAYDSLLEHDLNQSDPDRKYSLHFEGRAVDLTTWPIDLNRYPRLCALAHCAGFDWVHNEGGHCHAAINAESLCLRCND